MEDREKKHPGRLAQCAFAKQIGFPAARQIRVVIVISKMRMVLHVIAAKAHRGRKSVRQVGKNCDPFVRVIGFKDAIVGRVVDDDEHGVIGEGANAKSSDERRPPIGETEIAEQSRNQDLPDDDREGDQPP